MSSSSSSFSSFVAAASNSNPANPNMPASPSTSSPSLPKPTFNEEALSFSTKKERRTPNFRLPLPPRPPAKSCPPISRVFKNRTADYFYRAQAITFLDSPDGSLTGTPFQSNGVYDRSKKLSYFQQAFTVERKIGAGFFGTVYKVISKEDGRQYAVKVARERYRGQSDRARKLEEVRKHQFLLPHSNCVHFYQSWEENGRLYQQFELCKKSLQEFAEENHDIPETLIWSYLVDLLLAVQHLHSHNLIHMDIKPENIFIGMDGICKLGDFGIVIDLAKEEDVVNSAIEGDPKYLAAEVLERNYSKAADIFALGVTILELSCDLDLPKHGPLWHQLRQTGPDPSLTSRLSPELRNVIQLMMIKDPDRRPTVEQLLQLPSIQKARAKRTRELYIRGIWQSIKSCFTPIWTFSFFLWRLITTWLSTLRPDSSRSPGPTMTVTTAAMSPQSAFSSDEEDGDYSILSSSTHSSLASPLFEDSGSDPVPIAQSTSPSKMEDDFSPPNKSGLRHRSRFIARTPSGSSPQKRLNFSNFVRSNLDSSIIAQDNDDEDDDDDDDSISFEVKPVVLADKFDCFSDSDVE